MFLSLGGGAEYIGIYTSFDWTQVLLAFRMPILVYRSSLPFSCWQAIAIPSLLLFWVFLSNPLKLSNLFFTGSPSDSLIWSFLLQVKLRLELFILPLEVFYLFAEWLDDSFDELENLFLLHASYYKYY